MILTGLLFVNIVLDRTVSITLSCIAVILPFERSIEEPLAKIELGLRPTHPCAAPVSPGTCQPRLAASIFSRSQRSKVQEAEKCALLAFCCSSISRRIGMTRSGINFIRYAPA